MVHRPAMIKTILVPLDGSTTAEAVLPLVTTVAAATGAEVRLFTAVVPVAMWDTASTIRWDAEEAAARGYVLAKAEELSRRGLKACGSVAIGEAAELIIEAAESEGADLVAMTTHGRSGIGRWIMGSVADKVLHEARAPLLLVRPSGGQSARTQAPSIGKILVPLDGSELSRAVLPLAMELGKSLGASLVLMHAVSVPWVEYPGVGAPAVVAETLDELKGAAAKLLASAAAEIASEGSGVTTAVTVGPAADAISVIAEEEQAGLIAMSTHGRSGAGRWVLGSVADAVVRRTHLPCLLVRPAQAELAAD